MVEDSGFEGWIRDHVLRVEDGIVELVSDGGVDGNLTNQRYSS